VGEAVFVSATSGLETTGVATVEQSLLGSASPEASAQAVLATEVVPEETGSTTVTAKVREPPEPAGTAPTASMQVAPALVLGTQLQPGDAAPGSNVVPAGTVSTSDTAEADAFPRF